MKAVLSIPVATAQCHRFLRERLRAVEVRPASSTAGAARIVAEGDGASAPEPGVAAIAPRVAAERYGLEVLAADIADHPGNQTRFVVVAREGVPARTGHDRTGLLVFQRADVPGSLVSILQEFAARRINLSNLLSRPTKDGGLGDYCFVIYADAHIADELLADAVRALHLKHGRVKFLGSYPIAGEAPGDRETHVDARWQAARDWVAGLQAMVEALGLVDHRPQHAAEVAVVARGTPGAGRRRASPSGVRAAGSSGSSRRKRTTAADTSIASGQRRRGLRRLAEAGEQPAAAGGDRVEVPHPTGHRRRVESGERAADRHHAVEVGQSHRARRCCPAAASTPGAVRPSGR